VVVLFWTSIGEFLHSDHSELFQRRRTRCRTKQKLNFVAMKKTKNFYIQNIQNIQNHSKGGELDAGQKRRKNFEAIKKNNLVRQSRIKNRKKMLCS
jgi:hypothetical protein